MSRGSNLTRQCLTFDERPPTPERIQKFRRSAYLEPGKRFQHHGVYDDLQSMHLDQRTFGIADPVRRDGTAELLSGQDPALRSEAARLSQMKAEMVYHSSNREPLGHSMTRGTVLPSRFVGTTSGGNYGYGHSTNLGTGEAFGIRTVGAAEAVKELLFPAAVDDSEEAAAEIYKRTHGSYAPGEQKRRGYDWASVDPNTTRFGRRGDTIAFNGVSSNIAEVLGTGPSAAESNGEQVIASQCHEAHRRLALDALGTPKDLGQGSANRPADLVYGKSTRSRTYTVAEVMRGKYSEAEQAPDVDLGVSLTPGFRNRPPDALSPASTMAVSNDRAYGCPSIRRDIPAAPPNRRSLADSQNYGDDAVAADLISPAQFADLSIGPLALQERRGRESVLRVFRSIGYDWLSPQQEEELWQEASRGESFASIASFRDALNAMLVREGRI